MLLIILILLDLIQFYFEEYAMLSYSSYKTNLQIYVPTSLSLQLTNSLNSFPQTCHLKTKKTFVSNITFTEIAFTE